MKIGCRGCLSLLSIVTVLNACSMLNGGSDEGKKSEMSSSAMAPNSNSSNSKMAVQPVEASFAKGAVANLSMGAQDSSDPGRSMEQREMARRQEAQVSAQQALADADSSMKDGNYDHAILKLKEALIIIRYNPFVASPTLDARSIQDKLEQVMAAREAGLRAQKVKLEKQAQVDQAEQEKSRQEYVEKKIHTLFENANYAFLNEKYREAELYLDQLLTLDPQNHDAKDLRTVAIDYRHESTDRNLKKQYKEAWQKTFEKLQQMDVPQTQSIEFDLKRWAEVSKRKPVEVAGPDMTQSPEETEILNKLNSTVFPPRFDGAPIDEVASFLQHLTGVNFLLSNAVRDMDPEKKKITIDLPETSVKRLLDIFGDLYAFRYRINHGLVQIITPEEMKGGQYLAFYEVRDITKPIPNFPTGEVNLIPSAGGDQAEEELPERDSFIINESTLVDLIKNNIETASWEADPRNTIQPQKGTLVVSQTRDVHEKIKNLLKDLREATGIMVDVQARFLTVEDNFLSDIGVDIRGLGNQASTGVAGAGTVRLFNDYGTTFPNEIGRNNNAGAYYSFAGDSDVRARAEHLYDLGLGKSGVLTGSGGLSMQYTFLDNVQLEVILRAVEKSERVQIINAPRLLVFNTERASIRILDKVSYIRDYDVQIAQAATIADPIVDWINAGVFLDVTPVVSSDRRFITMELRPTVANLQRPIKTLSTNLATGSSVNIQLPELEVQRVRTTVSIPDGGTILLAGATVVEKQDYKTGIPFLSQIPVLSFFFSRKGEFNRNKKLLMLVRAKVVIPEEYEPTASR